MFGALLGEVGDVACGIALACEALSGCDELAKQPGYDGAAGGTTEVIAEELRESVAQRQWLLRSGLVLAGTCAAGYAERAEKLLRAVENDAASRAGAAEGVRPQGA